MLKQNSLAIALFLGCSTIASAQQGYEFEVYDTDIGHKGSTEIELHTNYVPDGLKTRDGGIPASHQSIRSSLELSHTLNSWLQGSLYLTTRAGEHENFSYVGNRARITAVAPRTWSLPFELALANEVIYARPEFSENRWAYELTPILSRNFGSLSVTLNPAFERGLDKRSEREIEFEPRGQVAYSFGDEAKLALEYYGGLGAIEEKIPVREQRHQLFARIFGELAPRFEAGIGVGRGLTPGSDRWTIATVFEYEIH